MAGNPPTGRILRGWMLPAGSQGFDELYQTELPDPFPRPGGVLIAPRAWSINDRDFAVVQGKHFNGILPEAAIPMSDISGEVLAVGEGVANVSSGADVQSVFFLDLLKGVSLRGIFCGSREMAAKLNAFVGEHDVKPTIGGTLGFDEVPADYVFGWCPDSFGLQLRGGTRLLLRWDRADAGDPASPMRLRWPNSISSFFLIRGSHHWR